MVLSTTWLEFKDMAQDPLVRREPVSASCNRRPDEGLETQQYSLYYKEHPASCPLRWRLGNGLGCISHYCKLDLVTIQGNGRRLHEAETGSRLTNGSCAMSLNSNHVVLSTMSNVFVDVGLPTVDV
jgi:hypothetical protein